MLGTIQARVAVRADTPVLRALIDTSVRGLQSQDYTPLQIENALQTVFGVDSHLIADGTYLVAESTQSLIVGCGGWSKRKTLYGGDRWSGRQDDLLDPLHDAAKIRAFFIHPEVDATRDWHHDSRCLRSGCESGGVYSF